MRKMANPSWTIPRKNNVGGMKLNREELKALGLTDEQIDKVMAAHGQVVNNTKQELQTVTTDRDNLKQQLSDRDTQLINLKKEVKDNEELTTKISELEQANETTKNDYEEKLQQQAFDFALDKGITAANVHNPKAVKALLDLESIKLDGDKLLGFEDQMKALKESDPYQFKVEEEPNPSPQIVVPGNPNGGGNPPNDPFAAKLAKYTN